MTWPTTDLVVALAEWHAADTGGDTAAAERFLKLLARDLGPGRLRTLAALMGDPDRPHDGFTERIIAAQEAERRRLAADIHDGITQRLCSLRFHLDAAAAALRCADDSADEQVARARELADLTFDEARAAVSGLRPPVLDDLGLADGLASLARSTANLRVAVEADPCRLPEHVEIALYRIAQEALQNVVKHAGSPSASVRLRRSDGEVVLRVSDAGRGFDQGRGRPGGYGLRSMAERAELVGGGLEVWSRLACGTTVTARIPLS